jgi:hypothetical protein
MEIKQNIANILTLTMTLAILTLFACKESTEPEEEIILPENDLTYSEDIFKLFSAKCATPGCHNSLDRSGNLDLTNYPEIMIKTVDNETIVKPGDGEQSFLYRILLENYKGRIRMPLDRAMLNSNNRNGVKVWIDEGAKP